MLVGANVGTGEIDDKREVGGEVIAKAAKVECDLRSITTASAKAR